MFSAITLLSTAGLLVAATAHAQMPERALLSRIPTGNAIAGTSSSSGKAGASTARSDLTGERALLGSVGSHAHPTKPADVTATPVDGARALLGKWPSATVSDPRGTAGWFRVFGKARGDVGSSASGEAEFGSIRAGDGSAPAFVVSLGGRGDQSAILFTRVGGALLGVGRYRISDHGNGAGELLALVTSGSPTKPTGVFRGRSGWLEVTAASDGLLTGRFEVDAVGFRAEEPEEEDLPVSVSGSFSAAAAGSVSQAMN